MIAIQFTKPNPRYDCGEPVGVTVRWSELPANTETLEIRLIWFTRGKGDRDVRIVACHRIAQPSTNGSETVNFDSPGQPYSFSGKLISLIWAVEVIVFPARQAELAELVIAPGGNEIQLEQLQTAQPSG